MRQCNFFCMIDCLLKRRSGTCKYLGSREPKVRQCNRRNVRVGCDSLWKECGRAAESSEEHFAPAASKTGSPSGQIGTGKSIGSRISLCVTGLGVEFRDAIVSTQPQKSMV